MKYELRNVQALTRQRFWEGSELCDLLFATGTEPGFIGDNLQTVRRGKVHLE